MSEGSGFCRQWRVDAHVGEAAAAGEGRAMGGGDVRGEDKSSGLERSDSKWEAG